LKFSNISEYYFNSDNVTGYLSDFSKHNHEIDSIKLHEETITKNEISSDVDINNFDPIVLSLYPNKILSNESKNFEARQLILLDGHHRWKYANQINLVNKLKCILVNFKDVKVKSYFFKINIEKDKFINHLSEAGYLPDNNGKLGIYYKNEMYINKKDKNIFDLYNFKKSMQDDNVISPILEDGSETSTFVKFTSLKPEDLLSIDHLLPPKSTWITPRI
tara:strand:+ start:952 stop:1608 length:657 start_codon:yes stop_codon:yes gene_type:complete